ncbi:hypothetical protein GSI_01411 [Ganoderma sinense ZZ0214-1]|uniref:Uncharacterized protein n=1 Tax=Ganoderma sinense ZZ0214-1 TaxID=1077348 RepID=A0A2G8SVC3_9APHY|nr:hypothetical protein GSI_01411 [Ganoderma sinense ZZ0214-1]
MNANVRSTSPLGTSPLPAFSHVLPPPPPRPAPTLLVPPPPSISLILASRPASSDPSSVHAPPTSTPGHGSSTKPLPSLVLPHAPPPILCVTA